MAKLGHPKFSTCSLVSEDKKYTSVAVPGNARYKNLHLHLVVLYIFSPWLTKAYHSQSRW